MKKAKRSLKSVRGAVNPVSYEDVMAQIVSNFAPEVRKLVDSINDVQTKLVAIHGNKAKESAHGRLWGIAEEIEYLDTCYSALERLANPDAVELVVRTRSVDMPSSVDDSEDDKAA
jgi:hypothetical protein